MAKREHEEDVAEPAKKMRLEETQTSLQPYFARLLAFVPAWLKKQHYFTLHGAIDWDGWLATIDESTERAWLQTALKDSPVDEGVLTMREAAVWIWFFAKRHIKYHYGSYELQVILSVVVQGLSGSLPTCYSVPVEKALRALVGLPQTQAEKTALVVITTILSHRAQLLSFSADKDGVLYARLYYHTLFREYAKDHNISV